MPSRRRSRRLSRSVGDLPCCSRLGSVSSTYARIENILQTITTDAPDVAKEKVCELSRFCDEEPWYKKILLKKGIQGILEYIIGKHDSGVTTCALLLLASMYKEEELVARMLTKTSTDFIKRLLDLCSCFSVATFQKCCLTIMTILTKDTHPRRNMYRHGVGEKIFLILNSTVDRGVQKQTFMFFLQLLQFDDVDLFLTYAKKLHFGILLGYLDDINPAIQDMAIKSLMRLSNFNTDAIQKSMANYNVDLTMFHIIMNSNKCKLHLGAMIIILNTIKSPLTCQHIAKSKEFEQFLGFMDMCNDEFAVFSGRVLVRLSEEDNLLQILHDLNAENGVLSLLRFNDAMINYEIVSCANNATKHKRLCDKFLCADLVESMINLVTVPVYPPSYRVIGLAAIYNFLTMNSRMLNLLYTVDKDCQIVKVFNYCTDSMKEEVIELLLRIIEKCSISSLFRKRMESEIFCRRLLQQFGILDDKISPAALDVLKLFVHDQSFMEYFVCWNGPKMCIKKILCTDEELFLKRIFEFICDACTLEDVCLDFINEKLHICLENLNPNIRQMEGVNKVLDKLDEGYLPLKFYRKGRIEVEEFIDTGFYVISGIWRWDFPLLNEVIRNPVTDEYTVYLVDYSAHPSFENIDLPQSVAERRREKKINKRMQKRFGKFGVVKETSLATIPETNEISVVSYRCIKKTNPVYYRSISQDLNLAEKLEMAWKNICETNTAYSVSEQVAALAKYVEMTTCGFDDYEDDADYCQAYLDHIHEVKVQRESNVVPIGWVKYGTGVERAILFKALADKIGLLASLVRGPNGFIWNEVPINMSVQDYVQYEKSEIKFGIVDLTNDVGQVMVAGSREANMYVGGNSYVQFSPVKIPLLRHKQKLLRFGHLI